MRNHMSHFLISIFLSLIIIAGCADTPIATEAPVIHTDSPAVEIIPETPTQELQNPQEIFSLASDSFQPDELMADQYSYSMGKQCSGENLSPALTWRGAPEGTKSFVLTMIDPDGGDWVHWLLVNVPGDAWLLPEKEGGPDAGVLGMNSFGKKGYGGPCPPSGTHHYIFTLYALDTLLEVQDGITYKEVSPLMEGHILAQTSLTGLQKSK